MKDIKRIIFGIIIIVLLIIGIKSCIVADKPEVEDKTPKSQAIDKLNIKYPGPFKDVFIKGKDYKQARGEVGKFGGTLYTSTIGEGPKTFNPWNAKDATSDQMGALMFDGLVSSDAYTGAVIPQMAKSFSVDKSGKVYTVKLRKGLKWSDGMPITSEDVVFTFNRVIGEGFGNTSMRDTMLVDGKMPNAVAIDRYTIKFITPKPFAPFLRQLGFSIAPKHIVEPIVNQGKQAFDEFWGVTTPPDQFVTSGMFKLSKYIAAQRVEFIKNPNYYFIDKKGQKLPYLDKYVFQIVSDNNGELLKFEAGEIDTLSVMGPDVAKVTQEEKNSDYKLYNLGPDAGTMFITFNLNRRKNSDGNYYVDPIKQRWFNDQNFRKALDYTIDREALVANVLCGVGAPLYTAESLSSIYLNQKLKNGHPRDIKLARNLLKESGFKWNKQGMLFDRWNHQVEFNIFTNAGASEREATGVMIKQDLEELGIKVNFKPIEFNVLVGKLNETLDWDAIIIGLTGNQLEPHGGVNVWSSTGSLHLFNQRMGKDLATKADLRPWEKELDTLFREGAGTLDIKKRHIIYDKYQQVVYDQDPITYLYSQLRIFAVRKKIGNIHPTPLGGITHNLEEIYIKD